jgi:exonuclease VII small subunit
VEQINTTWETKPLGRGTQISKILDKKLQKSRNKKYNNPGTNVTKIREQILQKSRNKVKKIWEQKSRNKNFKKPGTKVKKIWEQ